MLKERARDLRRNMTEAENRFWYYVRDRRLGGHKFVREKVIGNYIADFVCREKKLIIELDGGQHMTAVEYDRQRTTYLETQGYTVLRIWNDEIFKNISGVAEKILNLIESLPD